MAKKIAVILTDLFEDSEYTEPVNAFQAKGHEVITIGLVAGKTVKGKKEGTKVKIDKAVSEVTLDDFDALLIPGGYSPDKLRVDDNADQTQSLTNLRDTFLPKLIFGEPRISEAKKLAEEALA